MQDRYRTQERKTAAFLPALALALMAGAAAQAQDRLPSVSDYRLPPASPTAKPKAQGPSDPEDPVDTAPKTADSPAASAQPAKSKSTAKPTPKPTPTAAARKQPAPAASPKPAPSGTATAKPAAKPSASPSPSASASAKPRPQPSASPRAGKSEAPDAAEQAPAAQASPPPASVAPPSPAPAVVLPMPTATTTPVEWHVHSARESLLEQGLAFWPWLTALAFLLGAGVTIAVQRALRRVPAGAAAPVTQPVADEQPTSPAPVLAALEPEVPAAPMAPAIAAEPPLDPELDLGTLLAAAPAQPAPGLDSPVPASAAASPVTRVSAVDDRIAFTLAPRRMSATLVNAVFNYELVITNNSSETIGPVGIGGDMIGAHASLPVSSQLEPSAQGVEILHQLASLSPGESATLTGELRLPLSSITPIRQGKIALFVPLARFRMEAWRQGNPPIVLNHTFVIGENQDKPGAALKPFRLDLGPRLYSHIGQRAVSLNA